LAKQDKMKQHIDSNQIKELSPEKFRKLCRLVGTEYYCTDSDEQIKYTFQNESLTMYISILEKTNIGKMIEILLGDGCNCIDCTQRMWDDKIRHIFYGMPTCDALWKAVKREL